MKTLIILCVTSCIMVFGFNVYSQVAISSDGSGPDNSSMLDVKSTSKGFLVPRMSSAQMSAITAPVAGLLIYNTTSQAFYNFNGASWIKLDAGSAGILKDADGNTRVEVEKNPNEDIIRFSLGGTEKMILKSNRLELLDPGGNTFVGSYAGASNSSGLFNTGIGFFSLANNVGGQGNVSLGYYSLLVNTAGSNNTAIGTSSMLGTTGSNNTAVGSNALYSNSSGNNNTGLGSYILYSNTTGYSNVAIGPRSLYNNTNRSNLVAVGDSSLYNNGVGASNSTHSTRNTAIGSKSLYANTTGYFNTASGYRALYSNTSGYNNSSVGKEALYSNTTGSSNTALGTGALYTANIQGGNVAIGDSSQYLSGTGAGSQFDGAENTSVGSGSMRFNTTGYRDVAIGYHTLRDNTTGYDNCALGHDALNNNSTGFENTALGWGTLNDNISGSYNTAVGSSASFHSTTGYNTCVGYLAGGNYDFTTATFIGAAAYSNATSYTNCTTLGYNSRATASNRVVIGNSSVTSIGGYADWTNFSDGRYKTDVQENVKGIDFIMKLRPVTYHLDLNKLSADLKEDLSLDPGNNTFVESSLPEDKASREAKSRIVYTGFLAQEVEAAARSVGYDFSGVDAPQTNEGFYGLRYAEFVVPLVKGMQEQQGIIDEQIMMIKEQKQLIDSQQAQIEQMNNRLEQLEARLNR